LTPFQKSILELIDLSQLNCLNENTNHPVKGILQNKSVNTNDESYLLSDADEQLLVNITFNQSVRIRKIALRSSKEPTKAPKDIKLLINKPSVGFEDVENDAVQQIELSAADVNEGKQIPLRFVRFQAVNSLHIFVGSNQGDEDETRIDSIDIFGVPVETTKDLSGLRQTEE
jgi:hypothetical protein